MPLSSLPQFDFPVPLYYRVMEFIKEEIENGSLEPGAMVPSERELSEKFGISRMTVRQGINQLVLEGLVERKSGKGTFVAPPKIQQTTINLTSFSEDMVRLGQRPGARVLSAELREASPRLAKLLGLGSGQQVVRVERLRLANDQPMALEISHLHPHCAAILQEDLSQSLYRLLESRFGIRPRRADQVVGAKVAGVYEASLLNVEPGSALLVLERTAYVEDGSPIEFVESLYRADRYKYYSTLHR